MEKLYKFLPFSLLGVTLGTGWVPFVQSSDVLALAWSVWGQMTWLIKNAFLIAGVWLIVFFGFFIANKIFSVWKIKKSYPSAWEHHYLDWNCRQWACHSKRLWF